jgi:DNA mismatch endonuclease, patch repair protein
MAQVRGKDTQPEIRVRKVAHAMGLRFRLHRRDLKGTPDLVFVKYRVAIFVHGCFWHQHPHCGRASMPKSRSDFWRKKLKRNVERDARARWELEKAGWRVETIWECETKDGILIKNRLKRIFRSSLPKQCNRERRS